MGASQSNSASPSSSSAGASSSSAGASSSSSGPSSTAKSVANTTSYPALFEYKCNSHVAEFIHLNHKYYDELNSKIHAYAKVGSIRFSYSEGIISLIANLNASSSDKDACKHILDEFFSQFLSFEEKLEKNIPSSTLDRILHSPGLRCTASKNVTNNSIRITGIHSDVKRMISLLRDAQVPPVTMDELSTSTASAAQVSIATSSSSIMPSSFEDTKTSSVSTTTLPLNPTFVSSTSQSYTPFIPTFAYPTRQPHTSIRDDGLFSSNVKFVSTFHLFCLQAPDFAVARFIKYSDEHTSKLEQALSHLAQSVSIDVSNSKNIQYELRPVYDLRLTEEKFDKNCQEQLLNFLKNYSSSKERFRKDQLQRVNEVSPEFFHKKSTKDNGGVFIQWHYDHCLMVMAGPKSHLERKKREILEFLNAVAPSFVSPSFVFKLQTQDFSVARFIKFSSVHMTKLERCLEDVASVKIWMSTDRNKEQKERIVEYRCRPLRGLELNESDFETMCGTAMQNFLKEYTSTLKGFDRDHLAKVARKHPEFFEKRTSEENEEMFVEWQLDKSRVRVAGVKKEVDLKVKEIARFVETAVPKSVSSRHVFKFNAPDHSVARFIKQSPHHLGLLETGLAHLGTVKIWISAVKGEDNDKIIEYHCRPVTGLDMSDDEFDKGCGSALLQFLDQYSSLKRNFNHDHLMKVVLKEKDYFKNQTPEENQKLFVEWQVAKNRVRIAGIKKDVNAKFQEIRSFMDNAVPRTLRNAYEFDMEPPDIHKARFIKEYMKHKEALKDAIEDAKVWITPGRCTLHFKATIELTQLDVPQFEEKCKKNAEIFFKKYGVWRTPYSAAVLNAAQEQHPHFFENESDDFRVDILNMNQLTLVGVNPTFLEMKSEIMKKLQELVDENKAGSQFLRRKPSLVILQPYIYQPKAKANKMVIKHLFQSPIDLRQLHEAVGEFIHFIVYPSVENPLSMEFFPKPNTIVDVEYYNKSVPSILKKFFSKFLVSQKKCSPHQEKQVIEKVYEIGTKHRIPERVISIHKENKTLFIVGPKFVIHKIKLAINGSNSYGESIKIRLVSDPNSETTPTDDEATSSRKPSVPSVSDNPPTPKPRTVTPTQTPTKIPAKKLYNYSPKKQFVPMFTFVWDTLKFREELKSRFDDFCTLCGTAAQVKVAPKDSQKNDPQFMKKMVEKIESFLTSIQISEVDLDNDVINYSQENQDWLQGFYDPNDWAEICVLETSIVVKGFRDYVNKYVALIQEQLNVSTTTTEASSERCRVLSICGVIAETNRQLGGIATISCSVDEGLISCEGRRMFSNYAMAKLAEVGHLHEEPPLMSDEKQKALEIFLTSRQRNDNKEFIQKKLAEKSLKCVLLLQSGKVILTALTVEMHQKGSKYIDELMQLTNIPLPVTFDRNIFKQNDWEDLKNNVQDFRPVVIKVQDTTLCLIGLDKSKLQEAHNKINAFITEKMQSSQHIVCKDYVGRFILKYYVPDNLEVSKADRGLSINGSKINVDKLVKTLREIKWYRIQQTFTAPNLLSYFSSSAWKDIVKILEHDIKCTVDCDTTRCTSQFEEKKENIAASGTSNQTDFSSAHVKKTAYGSVTVSVCHGDITAEDTDVIVNGVIDRNFNLSAGAVSKALLRRAGSKMQEECDRADRASPILRCTKGWNLLCDHVIHIVTPREADKLTDRVKEALDHAELVKAKSVAIPTIGAGGIGLAATDVAAAFSQAIELFCRTKPRHVKWVKIVVFETTLIDLFQNSIVQAKETMGITERAAELAESKAKSQKDDEVVVSINSDDPDCLKRAKSKIVDSMSKVVVTKTFKEENLSKLQNNDRFDIFEAAIKHKASVTFNSISSEIVLKGLAENVAKLYDAIREVIFELKEAITLSKIANWKWASASNLYSSLPLRVSRAVENEYEKSKTGNARISMCGSDLWINFSQETFSYGLISGKMMREDQDSMSSYPPEWEDMLGKAMIKVPLAYHSSEYIRVMKLFQASRPSYSQVLQIERIQNPTLYSHYQLYKRSVERNMISNHPVERELFHGTDKYGIENILQSGFDRNFAGKNATVYGKGCYFAVNSRYSVDYVDRTSPTKYIILARVVTGDFCKGSSDMKAPPEKLSSTVGGQRYDSTVNDENAPTIFVVFKDSGVYPSYLITFS